MQAKAKALYASLRPGNPMEFLDMLLNETTNALERAQQQAAPEPAVIVQAMGALATVGTAPEGASWGDDEEASSRLDGGRNGKGKGKADIATSRRQLEHQTRGGDYGSNGGLQKIVERAAVRPPAVSPAVQQHREGPVNRAGSRTRPSTAAAQAGGKAGASLARVQRLQSRTGKIAGGRQARVKARRPGSPASAFASRSERSATASDAGERAVSVAPAEVGLPSQVKLVLGMRIAAESA